jgi:hypothetical protein
MTNIPPTAIGRDDDDQPVSQDFRKQFEDWLDVTYVLYQRWQRKEGLTPDECNERFWGKDLLSRWKRNL